MSKIPVLNYEVVIAALRRDGWIVVRQRGSHVRMQKRSGSETLKVVVPAHRPIKRSTLAHILKQVEMTADRLRELL